MADSTPAQAGARVLDVTALGKRVALPSGELTILDDVGFHVERGDTVAIVGASGSGKSTLLSLLAGLDVPTSGEVVLDGQPLSALDEDGRAQVRAEKVGFVFQNFQLLPSLTALENVMLPLELAPREGTEARAREWLERVGLGERVHHLPKQLSGGEQQRVNIARGFIVDYPILLLDEPLAGVDPPSEALILAALERERSQGRTIIMVTHDLSGARRHADKVMLINRTLVGMGTPEEMLSDAMLARLAVGAPGSAGGGVCAA